MNKERPLLITNGLVVQGTEVDHRPVSADILVRDGTIVAIGANLAMDAPDAETLDATDRIVVPGFINTHYHSHDIFAKGTMEEVPLDIWGMRVLPPKFSPRSREEIKVRTMLGALECLRSGITTVQDMVTLFPFDPEHLDAVTEAYDEVGIRAVVAPQYADKSGISHVPFWEDVFPGHLHSALSTAAEPQPGFDLLDYLEAERFSAPTRRRLSWALGPSTPESCSTELVIRTAALAEKYDLPIFTHIYESKSMALQARLEFPEHGGSLVRRLQAEGMLGPRVSLAHSVWLTDEEIELLAETGTNIVFNVLSNLKLKNGIPPVLKVERAGARLALGCDNSSASDSQNMFQVMKLTALLAAISDPNPGPDQAPQVFAAATQGGARAVGRPEELGRLAVGCRADLMLIDLTDPAWVPMNSAVRQLVYTESSRGVRTVVVDGRVVIRDGRSPFVDEAELRRRAAEVVPGYLAEFDRIAARVEDLSPYLLEAHRRTWAQDVGINRMFY